MIGLSLEKNNKLRSPPPLAELSVRISAWISAWISVKLRMSVSNYPYDHGYPWYTSRSDNRNTEIHADIHADIGATDLGAQFTAVIRGCTDNTARTSVMLRTVRPGVPPSYPKDVWDYLKQGLVFTYRVCDDPWFWLDFLLFGGARGKWGAKKSGEGETGTSWRQKASNRVKTRNSVTDCESIAAVFSTKRQP